MKLIDVFQVVEEIYVEKQAIQALQPGQSVTLPTIKQGSGKDRLEFDVTVRKPAA